MAGVLPRPLSIRRATSADPGGLVPSEKNDHLIVIKKTDRGFIRPSRYSVELGYPFPIDAVRRVVQHHAPWVAAVAQFGNAIAVSLVPGYAPQPVVFGQ